VARGLIGSIMYTKTKKFGYISRGCKYCRCDSRKVHWADTEYGWRLFNKKTGQPHDCKEKKAYARLERAESLRSKK
tara:strand:- start:124 stop:351 length:228 start_codon:yes stop_codon:yes gene_type:complete